MAQDTKIEWCDSTFNPWVGCTKISPGCDHCYAEGWAKRSGSVQWGPHAERRRTTDANWRQPLKWNREAEASGTRPRVFCASLADVFDNAVPAEWRADLFALIRATPHLDWLLVTKRIGNVPAMLPADWGDGYPNVWLLITVTDQAEADRDIQKLLRVPAAVRGLSAEPLLGPLQIAFWLDSLPAVVDQRPRLDWVIVGGESGPKARPMHPQWARDLRDQCAAAGVAFLFKQNGEWVGAGGQPNTAPHVWMTRDGRAHAYEPGATYHPPGNRPWKDEDPESVAFLARAGKAQAGRLLDGVQHDGYPGVLR